MSLLDKIRDFFKKEEITPWYMNVFHLSKKDYIIGVFNKNKGNTKEEIEREGKLCYLVYLDKQKDIRIKSQGENDIPNKEMYEQSLRKAYTKLKLAESFPVSVLNDSNLKTFKKLLGGAYLAALHNSFDYIDATIKVALQYAYDRNREWVRVHSLIAATIFILLILVLIFVLMMPGLTRYIPCQCDLIPERAGLPIGLFACLMGIVGSYLSIWTRYKQLGRFSMSGKTVVYCDILCRMLAGGICAYVAVLAIRSGVLLSSMQENLWNMGFVGVVAGFSERFIPTIIKHFESKCGVDGEDAVDLEIKPYMPIIDKTKEEIINENEDVNKR